MDTLVSNNTGMIHLIASIIALISGLFVVTTTKGTRQHKKIGYIYTAAMIIVNLTAFMMYNLYGKFAIFHWFAVVSCLTLIAGMYPILTRKSTNYILWHFEFMYWSVIGLYCAFVSEIFTRLPKFILTETGKPAIAFYKYLSIGIAIVMLIGVFFYLKFKPIWTKRYAKE